MTNLSKILVAVIAICFWTACSQKTQEVARTNKPNASRGQEDGQRPNRRGGPPQFSDLLTKMDSNNDGQLSIAEVEGRIKDNFTTIDTNADGLISEAEFKAAPRPKRRGDRNRN